MLVNGAIQEVSPTTAEFTLRSLGCLGEICGNSVVLPFADALAQ